LNYEYEIALECTKLSYLWTKKLAHDRKKMQIEAKMKGAINPLPPSDAVPQQKKLFLRIFSV